MIVCKAYNGLSVESEKRYEALSKSIESKQETIRKSQVDELKKQMEELEQQQANLELSIILNKPTNERTPEEKQLLYELTLQALTPNS